MEHSKDNTKNQTPTQNPALITDVKKAIQIALDESSWSRISHSKNRKMVVSENKRLKGDSGMHWSVNLAVTDGKEKSDMIIYCIDSCKDLENALTKAAAACQDLYFMDALMVLVIRKDKYDRRTSKLLPTGYYELFSTNHVDVIAWSPKHALELVVDLLRRLRRDDNRKKIQGIKSIRSTIKNLTEKYPDLFAIHRQIPKKTDCLEILQQIKECDPYLHYGEIIKEVLSQKGICQSLVGSQLSLINDVKLERLLKHYYQRQK